jgi:hypothetical protein
VSETYRVRVLGVKDGFVQEGVVAALATLFGRPEAEIQKIFVAKRVVIKNRMDLMEARKFRLTLEQRGCACIVEPDKPTVAVPATPTTATAESAPAAEVAASPVMPKMESAANTTTVMAFPALVPAASVPTATASSTIVPAATASAAPVAASPPLEIAESAPAAPATPPPALAIVDSAPAASATTPLALAIAESAGAGFRTARPAQLEKELTTCPRCDYTRKPNETVPDWQCPNCKVAYAKVTYGGETTPGGSEPSMSNKPAGIDYDLMRAKNIRAENIGHEAAVRSVGVLYYLVAAMLIGLAAFVIFAPPLQKVLPASQMRTAGAGVAFIGFLVYLLGNGLRRLRRWACIIAALGAASGLLALLYDPAKTGVSALLDAYILWVTMGEKGRYVTTAEYRAVIDETPDMKPGLGLLTWLLIAMVVLVCAAIGFEVMRGTQYPPGTVNPKNLAEVTKQFEEAAQELNKRNGSPTDSGLIYYGTEANGAELTMSMRVVRGSNLSKSRAAAQMALRQFGAEITCAKPALSKAVALGGKETFELYATEPKEHLIAQTILDSSSLNCPAAGKN